MKNQLVIYLVLLMVLVFAGTVQAKSLENRLGIGYSDEFSVSAPAIAAKYWPYPDLGFSAGLGIKTGENSSAFGLMVKIYRVVFPEDHMNFYMGGGAGLISEKITTTATENKSGFELLGFVGGEFFIPGLDSLGFSFEAGIGIVSLSSDVSFRTIGHHPLNAGMVFYF